MLEKTYLHSLRDGLHHYATIRRDVIRISGDALHHAKRAIFAMHRDNMTEAEEKLKLSEELLSSLHKTYKNDQGIFNEGSYKAAVEEFVEACLFWQFLTKGEIGQIKNHPVKPDVYLAGLCDLPGELYRYAIRAATKKDRAMVERCAAMAEEIVGELISFDLTKYLRTKSDQAKQATHKLDIVLYELSLRQ